METIANKGKIAQIDVAHKGVGLGSPFFSQEVNDLNFIKLTQNGTETKNFLLR